MNENTNNVVPITKDELLDVSNITLVRFMYYANRERIPAICSKLNLPEEIVLRYISMNIPKDEKLNHVIDYINAKTFDQLTPMEEMLAMIYGEIREEHDDSKLRSRLINNYVSLSKNYALYLDMLRRVNSMTEAGNQISFNFNIIDNHNLLPRS